MSWSDIWVCSIDTTNKPSAIDSVFLFPAEQAAVAGGERTFPGFPEGRDSDRGRRGFLQRCAQLLRGKTL